MNQTWLTWLLGGALVASLHWNFRRPEAVVEPVTRCEIDAESLDLTEGQQRDLERVCGTQCAAADDFEIQAEEKLNTLRLELMVDDLDVPRLRALAREITELRERSLSATVDSIVRVREILDADQLKRLMNSCCPTQSCCEEDGSR